MIYPVKDWSKWYDAQPFGSKTDYGYHEGADLNLKTGGDTDLGQSVFAIADGIVSSIHNHATSNNFGNHVHIRHDGPWGTVWCHYAHCSEILVTEGQEVKEGQLVAKVGKSGTVYSHLHWAIKLQPTGVDGIARTLEDLKSWTDPIKFVEKWMSTPTMTEKTYTEAEMTAVRLERDTNWNKYQEALQDVEQYKTQADSRKKEYDSLIEELAKKLVLPGTSDKSDILGAVDRLLEVEDQLNTAKKQLLAEEKKHEMETADLKTEIGRLQVQLDELKKRVDAHTESNNLLEKILSAIFGKSK